MKCRRGSLGSARFCGAMLASTALSSRLKLDTPTCHRTARFVLWAVFVSRDPLGIFGKPVISPPSLQWRLLFMELVSSFLRVLCVAIDLRDLLGPAGSSHPSSWSASSSRSKQTGTERIKQSLACLCVFGEFTTDGTTNEQYLDSQV